MKICLFFPSNLSDTEDKAQVNPPVGMVYVASNLKRAGHEVKFFDCMLDHIKPEEYKEILLRENPDMIGVGFVSTLRYSGFEYARIAKETLPHAQVIVGGVHSSIFPKKILQKYSFIDFVVSHEAEMSLLELIEKGPVNTKGVTYRDEKGEIIKNPPSIPLTNLDELAMPDWNMCNMEKYYETAKNFGADFLKFPHFGIITSRGCPNRCTFCGSEKLSVKVRRHTPQYVHKMLKILRVKHNVRDIYFLDDTFALDLNWLNELKTLLKENPIDIVFSGQIRANTPPAVIKMLKELGFYAVNIGVETGSQKVLNAMRKGIVVKQIKTCVKAAKENGLFVKVYLIFGDLAEETDDIRQTVQLVNSLPIDEFVWGRMTFFPGTELCTMRGIPDDWWFENNYMPLSEKFSTPIVNHAWFLLCVNNFFKQLRYKVKFNHKSWYKVALKQLMIIGGLGIFISKIPFKTRFRDDIFAYMFLPLGYILTKTKLNDFILKTFLKIKYKREDSIYFTEDKNLLKNVPMPNAKPTN
jgi:anaerobic magnesium-protoporphyrin IX monomethyl ester cyclase